MYLVRLDFSHKFSKLCIESSFDSVLVYSTCTAINNVSIQLFKRKIRTHLDLLSIP